MSRSITTLCRIFSPSKQRELFFFIFLAFTLFAARSAFADWNRIPTGSMQPTLYIGDLILVNKLAYDLKIPFTLSHLTKWADPARGDVVVFFKPEDGQRLIKRVIGISGDEIEMINNHLFINGKSVSYHNLPKNTYVGLSQQEQAWATFSSEALDEKTHPVMELPKRSAMRSFGPVNIPDGHYLMLGDNRDDSADSRYFGLVERKQIVGKATQVIVSWDKEKYYKPRFDRFFKKIDLT